MAAGTGAPTQLGLASGKPLTQGKENSDSPSLNDLMGSRAIRDAPSLQTGDLRT